MKITDEHVKKVCKIGTEKCCAYLTCGGKGFECGKFNGAKAQIDQRLKEGTMNATCDNCDGPPKEKILN